MDQTAPPNHPSFFQVTDADADARLDIFLARRLSVGRTQVRKLLTAGQVSLNGRTVSESAKGLPVRAGATINVSGFVPSDEMIVIPRPDLPLTILNGGAGWIAVDKPAGMAVHPLDVTQADTLLNAAVARYPQIQGIGEAGLRSGVVHRLDVDTSGALLLALTQETWDALRSAFAQHRAHKTYLALVHGALRGEGRETMDLLISQHHPARVRVLRRPASPAQRDSTKGARRCNLSWKSLEHFGDTASLVEVTLGTGFLHQIRVMLAELGHPVIGDKTYGRNDALNAPRHMLHALRVTAAGAAAESPIPSDFQLLLNTLRVRSDQR
ncbi:MAG TPA: RluA family pseudouridine synthase [Tepidisphaeraceae bacterium]|jgi:23S rRNA pseudouridine1911/1915/1917 synthase